MENIYRCAALALFLVFNSLIYGQVGINTESPKTTLDLHKNALINRADGFMTIRITGNELKSKDDLYGKDHHSTLVYVTAAASPATEKTSYVTTPGFYYYNAEMAKWINMNVPKFFYMPSVYFDTSVLGTFTKDLYTSYKNQFSTPAVKSSGASGQIPVVGKNDLEYYITYLDSTVFKNVTIDEKGIMTYTIVDNSSDISFLNIVFVVK